MKDYYKILGVDSKSSQEDIKSAYRKLAKKHHPDKNGNTKESENKFKEIGEAYSVLGNIEERKKYDAKKFNNSFNSRRSGSTRSGFGRGFRSSGYGNSGFSFDDSDEMFKRRGSSRERRDMSWDKQDTSFLDIKVREKADILELLDGKEIVVRYNRTTTEVDQDGRKTLKVKINLREKEYVIEKEGDSYVIVATLKGMGNESMTSRTDTWGNLETNYIFGDLIIKIEITSERKFKIEDGNIIEPIDLTLGDALFGNDSIVVNSMLGKKYKIEIKNPKNLNNLKFTVKGNGIMKGSSVGSYIAQFNIIPPDMTKISKLQLEKISEILKSKEIY